MKGLQKCGHEPRICQLLRLRLLRLPSYPRGLHSHQMVSMLKLAAELATFAACAQPLFAARPAYPKPMSPCFRLFVSVRADTIIATPIKTLKTNNPCSWRCRCNKARVPPTPSGAVKPALPRAGAGPGGGAVPGRGWDPLAGRDRPAGPATVARPASLSPESDWQ
jgi:hypothetical protein